MLRGNRLTFINRIDFNEFRLYLVVSILNTPIMKITDRFLIVLLTLIVYSCTEKPEDLNLDPETEVLVEILKGEMKPLPINPLAWTDEDLVWLDPIAGKLAIALGEATHGSAEFFKAKHRIFKYLVENHDYKIFAFEADFGESLYINEAVQNGRAGDIEDLMKAKMHFWTWKTREVQALLEWMCNYNQGKSDAEKVQYMGVDCQFNTHHPDMIEEFLEGKGLPFEAFADSLMNRAKTDTETNFEGYLPASFETYLDNLDALNDSLTAYKDIIIASSSEKEFELHARILRLTEQVSEVRYAIRSQQSSTNYRDKYMAENIAWLSEYFEGEKIVVWAHNWHISDYEYGSTGSMGNYLSYKLGNDYATIGFLFSQGTFTAQGMEGDQHTGLEPQTLDTIPRENSLNAIMSYTREPAFSIELLRLQAYTDWFIAFNTEMEYFQMGGVYNNNPGDYYSQFDPFFFDYLIYFDKSTASVVF